MPMKITYLKAINYHNAYRGTSNEPIDRAYSLVFIYVACSYIYACLASMSMSTYGYVIHVPRSTTKNRCI